MDDFERIRSNVQKMIDMKAPQADIDGYLQTEGLTAADFKTRLSGHSKLGVLRTGALQGVADVVGLPDTAGKLLVMGQDKVSSVLGGRTQEQQLQEIAAAPPSPPGMGRFAQMPTATKEVAANQLEAMKTGQGILFPSQQSVENKIFNYVPRDDAQTKFEKIMQMGARGASGAALTGGATAAPGTLIGSTIRTGVSGGVGGIASEIGGQLTEGTAWEPWVRFGAGLLAGGATQATLDRLTTAESLLKNTLKGYDDSDYKSAAVLMAKAEENGIRVTPAEALAQVKGGNTPLMAIQRYAENAPESSPIMRQFMEQRPGQNAAAVGSALDNLAPNSGVPTEIGPRLQSAAQQELDTIRQGINAEARPFYDQAKSQSDQLVGLGVNPYAGQQWDDLMNTPAFRIALEEVRNDKLAPQLANLPDYDIRVLDAVKKRMDRINELAKNPGVGVPPDTTTVAIYTAATKQLKGTVDQMFDDYATARAIGAEGRQTKLLPAGRSPLGQIAETADTVKQQSILLPKLASEGSPEQITKAVATMVKNGAETEAAELIRLKLQDVFDTSLPTVKGSAEQFRGANFANNITRYENQIKSLEMAIKALPQGGKVWNQLSDTLQAFKAQGQRLPAGSATEFNRLLSEQASQAGGLVSAPLRIAQAIPNLAKDAIQNMALKRAQKELADIFTGPNGLQNLQNMANRPLMTGTNILLRGLMSSGQP